MKEQQRKLNEKLRGHDGYYGVTGNYRMLSQLRWEVAKLWRKWLVRRNRGNSPNWESSKACCGRFPCCLHGSFTPNCNETTTLRNRMR